MMNIKVGYSMRDRVWVSYKRCFEDLLYIYNVFERVENWGVNRYFILCFNEKGVGGFFINEYDCF